MITNKEFQKMLQKYHPDVEVFVDSNFGWNTPTNEGYEDPFIHVETDPSGNIVGLEISTKEYPKMNIETIKRIIGIIKSNNSLDPYAILEKFNYLYE